MIEKFNELLHTTKNFRYFENYIYFSDDNLHVIRYLLILKSRIVCVETIENKVEDKEEAYEKIIYPTLKDARALNEIFGTENTFVYVVINLNEENEGLFDEDVCSFKQFKELFEQSTLADDANDIIDKNTNILIDYENQIIDGMNEATKGDPVPHIQKI